MEYSLEHTTGDRYQIVEQLMPVKRYDNSPAAGNLFELPHCPVGTHEGTHFFTSTGWSTVTYTSSASELSAKRHAMRADVPLAPRRP